MKRYAGVVSFLLCSLLLSGCDTPKYADYDSHYAFPTTAQRKTARLDISPLQQGYPSPADQSRLAEFLAAYHQQGESPMSVTVTAPNIYDIRGRREAMNAAMWLQGHGIPATDIRLYVTESPVPAGPQLTFPIYIVTGRDCGNWSTSIERDYYSQNTDNFGCALQQNIDAMAANPRDLVKQREPSGRDGERAWLIVTNYQQGKPIPGSDDLRAGVMNTTGATTVKSSGQ